MAINKEDLLKLRLPEDDVEVEGIGTFRVRGLSRFEVLVARQGKKEGDVGSLERSMLAFGLLDPTMTEAEVGQWQKASPANEIEPVSNRIAELSGLKPDSQKEAYKSAGGEQGTGVRVLPSTEAVKDSERASGESVQ